MMLKQRKNYFTPANFALASAGCLGTTQKFEIDRTWPIEEIIVVVNATAGATGPTLSGPDNILAICKRINLSVNDGNQPRSVVDFTGPGLLEYAAKVGLNLDRGTLASVALSKGSTVANSMAFRIAYRIPLVHPMLTEPLRTRSLLPVHTYPQNPVLTVEFEQAANIYSAGSLASVVCEIILVRRVMPADLDASIQKSGGYIPFDLLETPFTIATGVSGEQRFAIPTPGQYTNLLFRQYLGGSSVTRDVLDQTTTFGSESRWRLESGGAVQHEWRWKHLQIVNDWSGVANSANQTYSPNFAGAIASNTSYQPAASCLLDFLTDGLDSANELGSVLDCNVAANSGLKMEVIGAVASVATNGSTLYIGGHRLFGDLSKWQALKF